MIKKWIPFLLISYAFAQEGTDLIMSKEGANIDLKQNQIVQKQLVLDDPFVIQLYGTLRAKGIGQIRITDWANLVFTKEYTKALNTWDEINQIAPKSFRASMQASKIYLLWKLNRPHGAVNAWLQQAKKMSFLNSEYAVALDSVIAPGFGKWLVKNGIILSDSDKGILAKIERVDSRINFNLQALRYLRTGEKALRWIAKLDPKNPLRHQLAYTVVLSYATQNKLGNAAKLLKEVIEPHLLDDEGFETLSQYHILLARLLYQASAIDASREFYELIPQESSHYLKARAELLWVYLRLGNLAKIKGQLASFDLKLFEDEFMPNVYLVNAISNLKLCQFPKVKRALNLYISKNTQWLETIDKNLASDNPLRINPFNFYINQAINAKASIRLEEKHQQNKDLLQSKYALAEQQRLKEIKREWNNRKKILEKSLLQMQFVKIETLSLMRKLAKRRQINIAEDEIASLKAAPARRNEVKFAHDEGYLFGDEVFNMSSDAENHCLIGGTK
jgi:hypothetical protein